LERKRNVDHSPTSEWSIVSTHSRITADLDVPRRFASFFKHKSSVSGSFTEIVITPAGYYAS
jgi:hypothetical protein